MNVDEQDLRELFAQRTSGLHGDPDRVASVHRRIQRRRQRLSASVAGVTVAAAAVLAVSVVRLMPASVSPPAHRGTSNASLTSAPVPTVPRYGADGKLLGGAVLDGSSARTASFRFRPTSWQLTVVDQCQQSLPDDVEVMVAVNGRAMSWGGCGGASSGGAANPQQFWSQFGVRLGEESTVTLTLIPAHPCPGCTPAPLPSSTTVNSVVTAGVYQRIPFEEFPLPPAPRTLSALPAPPDRGESVSAVGVGDNVTTSLPASVNGDRISVTTVAPGDVSLLVDGVLIAQLSSRDYTVHSLEADLTVDALRGSGVEVRKGQAVTVTVRTEHFRQPAWSVSIWSLDH
ncbi:MAG: hypothetical protein ACTHMW_08905 [Actinomycetes bacterium]